MTRLIPFPVRLTDTAGRPLSGAKAYFYATGTTDLQDTYTSTALSTANANPVVSNSAGLFGAIYLDPDLTYDILFTDSSGSTIQQIIGVSGAEGLTKPYAAQAGASYTVTAGDRGSLVKRTHSATMTVTLPAANGTGIGNGFTVTIWNGSSYDLTVSVTGGGTIDGASSRVLKAGHRVEFLSTGSEWTADAAPIKTGVHELCIPAGALIPRTTSGPEYARVEASTYDVNYDTLKFDATTTEYADYLFRLPASYNGGAISAAFAYTHSTGTAAQTLTFGIQGRCLSDSDAIDQAHGTAGEVSDAIDQPGDHMETSWVSFTPTSAAAAKWCQLTVYRKGSTGTFAGDAWLRGVTLRITLDGSADA